MKLNDYLTTNEIKPVAFAKEIGVSVQSVHRYINGLRIPDREIMPKIVDATDGKVTANSFYQ